MAYDADLNEKLADASDGICIFCGRPCGTCMSECEDCHLDEQARRARDAELLEQAVLPC